MKSFFYILSTFIFALYANSFANNLAAAKNLDSLPKTKQIYDTIKTTYSNGSIERIYTVIKGIREGISLSYHPNGVLAIEAPYKNGKLDGVFRSYFENGKLWQTIGYKNGLEEGVSTTYFESGNKKKRESYKNGELDGITEEYFENGSLQRKLPYVNGHLHGAAKIFDASGMLKEEMHFENGLRHGTYLKYERGVKIIDATFERNRCIKGCNF